MPNGIPMNVDDESANISHLTDENQDIEGDTEGGTEAYNAEMGPDLTGRWVVEDGWFNTAPRATRTDIATDNLPPREEDTVMNVILVSAPAVTTEQSSGSANTVDSYPRTTRFADSQVRSDDEMMQDIMRSLGPQGSESTLTREVDASNPGFTTGSSNPSPEDTTPFASESRLENSDENSRGNLLAVNSQVNGTNGNVSQDDFMRFVRSVESLSVNVRILLGHHSNFSGRSNRNNGARQYGNADTRELLDDDDEPEEAQVRIRKKRSVEENRFHDVLRNLLVEYKLRISRRREQLHLKECVPQAEVETFELGRHDGPNLSDLRLDWANSMTSQWNSAAIYLLADHVLDRIKNNYYPGFKHEGWMTTHRIFEELKEKLAASKEEYENETNSNSPETNVNVAEKRARYVPKKYSKKIRNRRNMRRKTLYDCRVKIIHENLGSHPAWESALRLMNVIGDGAMSDDETDEERSTRRKKVVRRVQKQWTSTPLSNMLNTLDLYYSRFYWDGLQKPGPGPRDRLTTIVSESPRPTPKSLPGNCYNSLYLSSLSPYRKSLLRIKRDVVIPSLPLPPVQY